MMTQADIYKNLCVSRSLTRENMYASMYRLKKRNKISKSGKLWGLTGLERDVSEVSDMSNQADIFRSASAR